MLKSIMSSIRRTSLYELREHRVVISAVRVFDVAANQLGFEHLEASLSLLDSRQIVHAQILQTTERESAAVREQQRRQFRSNMFSRPNL